MTDKMEEQRIAINMAQDLLKNYIDSKYVFHNYNHTLNVAQAAHIIGSHSNLKQSELDVLILSAWFHDVGYCTAGANHEEHSAKIAIRVLSELSFEKVQLSVIENAILSTCMPQNPKTTIEKCLCDADMYHLSQPDYYQTSELLRQEMSSVNNIHYTEQEWKEANQKFILQHRYHTPYGKSHLESRKINNLKTLKMALKAG